MFEIFDIFSGDVIRRVNNVSKAQELSESLSETAFWARTGREYDYRPA